MRVSVHSSTCVHSCFPTGTATDGGGEIVELQLPVHFNFRVQVSEFSLQTPTYLCALEVPDACDMYVEAKPTLQHMMPVTPSIPNLSQEHDAHLPGKIHSQSRVTSISDFDCTSAFRTSDFKKWSRKAIISDFRFDFRNQTQASERLRNRDFDFRFQISDWYQVEKSKSRLRFQISDFRLAQGREIEIVSFISISGFDFRGGS